MKFINQEDVNSQIATSNYYMPKIDIDKNETKTLVQFIGKYNRDGQLLRDINILGQNIEKINTLDYSYKHLNRDLQFSELSRGEKVFLVSLAAKYSGEIIYLQYDILQLTKTNMRRFYELFKDCNNINIIYETGEILSYLNNVMQGVIK